MRYPPVIMFMFLFFIMITYALDPEIFVKQHWALKIVQKD
jgi:hypothetical protein